MEVSLLGFSSPLPTLQCPVSAPRLVTSSDLVCTSDGHCCSTTAPSLGFASAQKKYRIKCKRVFFLHFSPQSIRGRQQTQGSTSGPCSSSSLRCGAKQPTGTTPSLSALPRSTTRHSGTGRGKKLSWTSPHAALPHIPPPLPRPHNLSQSPGRCIWPCKDLFLIYFGAHCPSHELYRLHRLPAVPSLPLPGPDAAVGASPSPPFPCLWTLYLGSCNWELKA